jgi:hypothetical protein
MNTANSPENIDHNRTRLLGPAAMTVALPTCASLALQNAEITRPKTTKEEGFMTTAVALREQSTDTAAVPDPSQFNIDRTLPDYRNNKEI